MKLDVDSSSGQTRPVGISANISMSWPVTEIEGQPANIDNKAEERCEMFCLEICLCCQAGLLSGDASLVSPDSPLGCDWSETGQC